MPTSTRGPIVAARACSESTPYTPTATAMASSCADECEVAGSSAERVATHKVIAPRSKCLDYGCVIPKNIGVRGAPILP
jgi:hypothetical protein